MAVEATLDGVGIARAPGRHSANSSPVLNLIVMLRNLLRHRNNSVSETDSDNIYYVKHQ